MAAFYRAHIGPGLECAPRPFMRKLTSWSNPDPIARFYPLNVRPKRLIDSDNRRRLMAEPISLIPSQAAPQNDKGPSEPPRERASRSPWHALKLVGVLALSA